MSYDISFKVKVEGVDKYIEVGDCNANITWNVREIITKSTGLEWKNEENNGLCKNIIPFIKKGCAELINHPEKYRKYEAARGYGTVKGTIKFFKNIIESWERFKEYGDEEVVNVATFWIE